MKRLIGWLLTIGGGGALVWGGVAMLSGSSDARLALPYQYTVNAMTVGLVGVAVLTVGLIWVRD